MYGRWGRQPSNPTPGYTLLMPVPEDLPVFLDLALDVVEGQDRTHLAEILVVPDKPSARFRERFQRCARERSRLPLRLVELPIPDRWITHVTRNPHHNHWLQTMNGIKAAKTTHALLHDADLFIEDPGLLKSHYEACRDRGLSCLGVSPVWDDWYRESGYPHVVATWEMMCDVSWVRAFPPHQHRGHRGAVDGKVHVFDLTLLPQCLTPADRIARSERDESFVHFNYVICSYRWFQNSRDAYEDENFRVLLIRMLIDACDRSGWAYPVPSLPDLARGIQDPNARVTYRSGKTRAAYDEFRTKLDRLLAAAYFSPKQREVFRNAVAPFDAAFKVVNRA